MDLNLILGLIGAVSTLVLIPSGVRRTRAAWKEQRRRRAARDLPQDYYFKSIEFSQRFDPDYRHFESRRKVTIVALQDDLKEVVPQLLGAGRKNQVFVEGRGAVLEPERFPKHGDGQWCHYPIRFDPALKRTESKSYTFVAKVEVTNDTPAYPYWSTVRRADRLVLRVAFVKPYPQEVFFRRRRGDGHSLESRPLEIDPVTHEARYETTVVETNVWYEIVWDWAFEKKTAPTTAANEPKMQSSEAEAAKTAG